MLTRITAAVTTASLLALAGTAQAQEDGRLTVFGHHFSVIAGAAIFVPKETATKSAYGKRSFTPDLTLWSFETPRGVGLAWDLGGRRSQESGRRADLLHAGVGPRFQFASGRADIAPYLAIRGDAYVIRLDDGARRTRAGSNVELGASVLRHFVVSGRYDLVPKIDGVDLSGFSARAAVKVF